MTGAMVCPGGPWADEKQNALPLRPNGYSRALKHEEGNASATQQFRVCEPANARIQPRGSHQAIQKAYVTLSGQPEAWQRMRGLEQMRQAGGMHQVTPGQTGPRQQSVNRFINSARPMKIPRCARRPQFLSVGAPVPETAPDWPSGVSHNDLQAKVEKLKAGLRSKLGTFYSREGLPEEIDIMTRRLLSSRLNESLTFIQCRVDSIVECKVAGKAGEHIACGTVSLKLFLSPWFFILHLVFMVFSLFRLSLTLAIIGNSSRYAERERIEPSVTLIITAYNEERRIEKNWKTQ